MFQKASWCSRLWEIFTLGVLGGPDYALRGWSSRHALGKSWNPDSAMLFLQFEACLRKELETARAGRDDFLRDFSAEDYDAIVSGWQDKLVRVGEGEQRWGLFLATKPV